MKLGEFVESLRRIEPSLECLVDWRWHIFPVQPGERLPAQEASVYLRIQIPALKWRPEQGGHDEPLIVKQK
jgi:hypothetical protein